MSLQDWSEIEVVKLCRRSGKCIAVKKMTFQEYKRMASKLNAKSSFWYRAFEPGQHGYKVDK
jgi:hypothetical protein